MHRDALVLMDENYYVQRVAPAIPSRIPASEPKLREHVLQPGLLLGARYVAALSPLGLPVNVGTCWTFDLPSSARRKVFLMCWSYARSVVIAEKGLSMSGQLRSLRCLCRSSFTD